MSRIGQEVWFERAAVRSRGGRDEVIKNNYGLASIDDL